MHLIAFLAVGAIVVITPGVDMALVTKNALQQGRRSAIATALGVNLGIVVWTGAAALGLAALIAASAVAFAAVKLAGALYLIYLGAQALRESRSGGAGGATAPRGLPIRDGAAFRQGLLSNLLNPKIAVFFTSLLPQFVGTHGTAPDLLLLGALFNLMGIVWLVSYGVLAASAQPFLGRPAVKRGLDRLTGTTLVGLGIRLALEHRR